MCVVLCILLRGTYFTKDAPYLWAFFLFSFSFLFESIFFNVYRRPTALWEPPAKRTTFYEAVKKATGISTSTGKTKHTSISEDKYAVTGAISKQDEQSENSISQRNGRLQGHKKPSLDKLNGNEFFSDSLDSIETQETIVSIM